VQGNITSHPQSFNRFLTAADSRARGRSDVPRCLLPIRVRSRFLHSISGFAPTKANGQYSKVFAFLLRKSSRHMQRQLTSGAAVEWVDDQRRLMISVV
jgi:hypothetical protein